MWLIEVHWTQTASCHVLIGLARYSTASEGFCLISREIIYSTSNLLPVVKCHCIFTRPVFFMVQHWTSPRTSLRARKPRLSFPVFRLLCAQLLGLPVQLPLPSGHPSPVQTPTPAGATTLESQPWKTFEPFLVYLLLLRKWPVLQPQPRARWVGAGAHAHGPRAAAPVLLCVFWAFVSPITYYKQYSLSLSESLSKLATWHMLFS